ncbi:hypothetical protein [Paenibacillus sp. HB172176]|uniref:hypothetical protein n=1 Tax=Paenibacillus sp. HB172176 TaxID=2493690 RepID=UPI00143C21B4|nr:hypothetical protein [Paenibacillus sp. HB172176]
MESVEYLQSWKSALEGEMESVECLPELKTSVGEFGKADTTQGDNAYNLWLCTSGSTETLKH